MLQSPMSKSMWVVSPSKVDGAKANTHGFDVNTWVEEQLDKQCEKYGQVSPHLGYVCV